MVVTWVTFDPTDVSVVEYGIRDLNMVAKGTMDKYIDGGSEHRTIYMHRVTLTELTPGQMYCKSTLLIM